MQNQLKKKSKLRLPLVFLSDSLLWMIHCDHWIQSSAPWLTHHRDNTLQLWAKINHLFLNCYCQMTAIRKINRRGLLSDLKAKSMRKLLAQDFSESSQSLGTRVKLSLVCNLGNTDVGVCLNSFKFLFQITINWVVYTQYEFRRQRHLKRAVMESQKALSLVSYMSASWWALTWWKGQGSHWGLL